MEYLNSVTDNLKTMDETDMSYFNLFDYPELFYGNINFSNKTVDFCKFPKLVQKEMDQYGTVASHEMYNLNSSACGNRLRFFTSSKRIILKIQLKRKWGYLKMVNWNALGFDIYMLNDEKYTHKTVFAPMDGKNIFAESVPISKNGKLCIFLPNYNTIEKMYIGIEKKSSLEPLPYPENKKLPIIFYGNSVTQGAAASRSGNSFSNIVSRKLNRDIINLSCSSCCRGTEGMAELIGKINCHSIVIDYTRNAYSTPEFRKTHEQFYKNIRKFHPTTKIILMTSECFNHWKDYYAFDDIVISTYKNALKRGENTELLYQSSLFDEEEYDYVTVDSSHYTDYGMYKVADKLCELLDDDSMFKKDNSKKEEYYDKLYDVISTEKTKVLNNKIDTLHDNLIKKDNEIEALKKRVLYRESEITQLNKFKENVYNSFSWKITKPLRFFNKK